MPEYMEIKATGELAEVIERLPRTSRFPERVRLVRLNTGRGQMAVYTESLPVSAVRPADMSKWSYNPSTNRWTCTR